MKFSLKKWVYIGLIILSIIFFILKGNTKILLARNILSFVLYPAQKSSIYISSVKRQNRKIDIFKKRLISMSINLQKYRETVEENKRLRAALNFQKRHKFGIIPTEVIGRVPEEINFRIISSAGNNRSVIKDMPVVGYNGLIGKVTNVDANTSIIQTLFDLNSRVSVIDERTRVFGILEWNGANYLVLKGIPIDAKIEKGDTLITSGYGSVYPKGIRVGYVIGIKKKENLLLKQITVVPFEHISSIEELFIIRK